MGAEPWRQSSDGGRPRPPGSGRLAPAFPRVGRGALNGASSGQGSSSSSPPSSAPRGPGGSRYRVRGAPEIYARRGPRGGEAPGTRGLKYGGRGAPGEAGGPGQAEEDTPRHAAAAPSLAARHPRHRAGAGRDGRSRPTLPLVPSPLLPLVPSPSLASHFSLLPRSRSLLLVPTWRAGPPAPPTRPGARPHFKGTRGPQALHGLGPCPWGPSDSR